MALRTKEALKEVARRSVANVAKNLKDKARDEIDFLYDRAEIRIKKLETILAWKISAMTSLSAGIIFLALSIFYLFNELLALSKALSFFIVGILFLLIGVILKMKGGRKPHE